MSPLRSPVLTLTLVLLATSAVAADDRPARYVIVLGANAEGAQDRQALAFADDDAARFYLQAAQDADRAWLLTTFDADSARAYPTLAAVARAPTREQLAHALGDAAWLIRASKEQGRSTELVFFFAGHGDVTPGGEGYIVLGDGPFTRSELTTQVVRGSPADVNHVLLDACSSYFMVSARSGVGEAEAAGVPLSPALLDLVRGRDGDPAWQRTGVLVSTSTGAAVHESADVGGGVFSYLLRSALAGAGDSDGDGRVEYAEAAAFIAASSGQIPDPRARLQVHARAPLQRPNVALADLSGRATSRFLAVEGGDPARVRILDARGQPWAELHREEGRPILLRLPTEPFLVVRVGDQEAVLVARKAGAYALSSLRFEASAVPRSSSAGRPFEQLFATAYGPAFLAGYLGSAPLPVPARGPALVVGYAAGSEPHVPLPLRPAAVSAFVGAGALTVAAAVCVGGNLLAFQQLRQEFAANASFESSSALEVEGWRTAATASAVGAVAAALVGGALWWAAGFSEASAPGPTADRDGEGGP